jgi:hypothetical protein
VQTQGVAKADAGARAKAEQIIAETNLEVARSRAQAKKIEAEAILKLQMYMSSYMPSQKQDTILGHE